MKKEYTVPEITLIEFSAKDMILTSLWTDLGTPAPDQDGEIPASEIFG